LATTGATSRVQQIPVSFDIIELSRNVSSDPHELAKRMELPKRSIGAFYRRELPLMSEPIVPDYETAYAPEMSTAVIKKFSSLGPGEQFSTGVSGLSGCTTMYIISRTGVYATHWWENVSFDPDAEWRDPPDQTNDDLFQTTVIDVIRNGGTYHPKLDASLIADDSIRAYLVRPTQTSLEAGPSDVGYPDQWQQIRDTVGDIIPALKDASRWKDCPYVALNNDDPRLFAPSGTNGKSVFKYDPAHKLGNGQTTRKAALWVEDEIVPKHDDQW
jgi:hypothetical protein